jgi:hypothetical protein
LLLRSVSSTVRVRLSPLFLSAVYRNADIELVGDRTGFWQFTELLFLQFHFLLNVAVGSTNGFIPDGGINRDGDPNYQKPWSNGDGYIGGMRNFYNARNNWKWTWDTEGENAAMQVDYVRVYQKKLQPYVG